MAECWDEMLAFDHEGFPGNEARSDWADFHSDVHFLRYFATSTFVGSFHLTKYRNALVLVYFFAALINRAGNMRSAVGFPHKQEQKWHGIARERPCLQWHARWLQARPLTRFVQRARSENNARKIEEGNAFFNYKPSASQLRYKYDSEATSKNLTDDHQTQSPQQ